jgi:hypothetical protein
VTAALVLAVFLAWPAAFVAAAHVDSRRSHRRCLAGQTACTPMQPTGAMTSPRPGRPHHAVRVPLSYCGTLTATHGGGVR